MGKETVVKRILTKGELGEETKDVLFNTGATSSLVRTDFAARIARLIKLARPRPFTLGNGDIIKCTEYTTLQFELNGKFLSDEFCAVDSLPQDMIVGRSAMQRWEMTIDFSTKQIHIGVAPERMELL